MAEITLPAATGRTTGTRPSKRLRAEGRVPATVYGLGGDAVSVSVDWRELRGALTTDAGINALINLEIDGHASELTIVKDLQRHPIRRSVLHVDFLRVSRDVAIEVDVPIVLHGRGRRGHPQRRRRRAPAVPAHDPGEAWLDPERDQRRHLRSRDQRLDPRRRPHAARGRRDRRRSRGADRHRPAATGRGARAGRRGRGGRGGRGRGRSRGAAPSEGGGEPRRRRIRRLSRFLPTSSSSGSATPAATSNARGTTVEPTRSRCSHAATARH